jgi:hypothetical protein
VEEVHKYIADGINAALNVVAPVKEITVKAGSNLYLTRETLEMMKRPDSARAGTLRSPPQDRHEPPRQARQTDQ